MRGGNLEWQVEEEGPGSPVGTDRAHSGGEWPPSQLTPLLSSSRSGNLGDDG